jgi:hypothetical protein
MSGSNALAHSGICAGCHRIAGPNDQCDDGQRENEHGRFARPCGVYRSASAKTFRAIATAVLAVGQPA